MYVIYYKSSTAEDGLTITVTLEDYEEGPEVEAGSRGEAVRKWYLGETVDSEKVRIPKLGDMIKSPDGKFFFLTGAGVWGLVSIS